MEQLTEDRKKFLSAYLFRLEMGHTDAIYAPHHGFAQTWNMMELELDSSGRFEFPYLPEGDWVLRLVSRRDDIVVQRQLHTDRNLVIDLGMLTPPKTVEVGVQVELPEAELQTYPRSFGMWIRKPVSGRARGIFVRTVHVRGGAVELGALEPGRYEVDLFSGFQA